MLFCCLIQLHQDICKLTYPGPKNMHIHVDQNCIFSVILSTVFLCRLLQRWARWEEFIKAEICFVLDLRYGEEKRRETHQSSSRDPGVLARWRPLHESPVKRKPDHLSVCRCVSHCLLGLTSRSWLRTEVNLIKPSAECVHSKIAHFSRWDFFWHVIIFVQYSCLRKMVLK